MWKPTLETNTGLISPISIEKTALKFLRQVAPAEIAQVDLLARSECSRANSSKSSPRSSRRRHLRGSDGQDSPALPARGGAVEMWLTHTSSRVMNDARCCS